VVNLLETKLQTKRTEWQEGCVACELTFSGECVDGRKADSCEYDVYEVSEQSVAWYDHVRVTCRVGTRRRAAGFRCRSAVQHEVYWDRLAAQLCMHIRRPLLTTGRGSDWSRKIVIGQGTVRARRNPLTFSSVKHVKLSAA